MPLNNSGPISIGGSTVGQSINLELGRSATAQSNLNETNLRTLAGVPSGQISLNNFYGKSNTPITYIGTNMGGSAPAGQQAGDWGFAFLSNRGGSVSFNLNDYSGWTQVQDSFFQSIPFSPFTYTMFFTVAYGPLASSTQPPRPPWVGGTNMLFSCVFRNVTTVSYESQKRYGFPDSQGGWNFGLTGTYSSARAGLVMAWFDTIEAVGPPFVFYRPPLRAITGNITATSGFIDPDTNPDFGMFYAATLSNGFDPSLVFLTETDGDLESRPAANRYIHGGFTLTLT